MTGGKSRDHKERKVKVDAGVSKLDLPLENTCISQLKKKKKKEIQSPSSLTRAEFLFVFCYDLLEEIQSSSTPNSQIHSVATGFNSLPFWIMKSSVRYSHTKLFGLFLLFPFPAGRTEVLVKPYQGC